MWSIAEQGDRIEFDKLSLDPLERHTLWNVFFGSLILWGAPYVTSQYLVQRCCCMATPAKAKLVLYLNYIGQFVLVTLVAIIGLIMYAYYVDCDPVMAGIVTKRDALIPIFVLQEFSNYPGIAGLFISCLFSGALSTLDSALNSLAAVTWEEVKMLSCFRSVTSVTENRITKGLSIVYGLISIGLAFVCSSMGSLINVGSRLFGACMGPMYGLCLMSVLCPYIGSMGALIGLVSGQVLNIWLSLGAMIYYPGTPTKPLNTTDCSAFGVESPEPVPILLSSSEEDDSSDKGIFVLYLLSYNIYPIIGCVATVLISHVANLVTGGNKLLDDPDDDQSRYVHPWAWKVYSKLTGKGKHQPKTKSKGYNDEDDKDWHSTSIL